MRERDVKQKSYDYEHVRLNKVYNHIGRKVITFVVSNL